MSTRPESKVVSVVVDRAVLRDPVGDQLTVAERNTSAVALTIPPAEHPPPTPGAPKTSPEAITARKVWTCPPQPVARGDPMAPADDQVPDEESNISALVK